MTKLQEDIKETMDLRSGVDFLCQDLPPHVVMAGIAKFLVDYFGTIKSKELQIEMTAEMASYLILPLCVTNADMEQINYADNHFKRELIVLVKELQQKCGVADGN